MPTPREKIILAINEYLDSQAEKPKEVNTLPINRQIEDAIENKRQYLVQRAETTQMQREINTQMGLLKNIVFSILEDENTEK